MASKVKRKTYPKKAKRMSALEPEDVTENDPDDDSEDPWEPDQKVESPEVPDEENPWHDPHEEPPADRAIIVETSSEQHEGYKAKGGWFLKGADTPRPMPVTVTRWKLKLKTPAP